MVKEMDLDLQLCSAYMMQLDSSFTRNNCSDPRVKPLDMMCNFRQEKGPDSQHCSLLVCRDAPGLWLKHKQDVQEVCSLLQDTVLLEDMSGEQADVSVCVTFILFQD
jgi:hypothetical protein